MASRLIDKLLVNKLIDDWDSLKTTSVINADNVVEYVQSLNAPTLEDAMMELPRITPPLKNMFIEYRFEDMEIGVLVSRYRLNNDDPWEVSQTIFWGKDPNHPILGWGTWDIDGDGFIRANSDKTDFDLDEDLKEAYIYPKASPETAYDDIEEGIAFSLLVALWTLAFMNCKNAVLEPVEPNAAENKRRAKHGKLPLMRYHVLKIKPFGNRSDNEAQGGSHASPALHIRRGHFKTYTDAAPLFGQFVGTYWWEQSIAGKKSNRVVVKDYEMDLTGAK